MQGARKWRISGNLRVTAALPQKIKWSEQGGAISRLHGALSSVNLRCNRLLMGRNLVCEFGPRYVLANIRIVPDRW